MMNTAPRRLCTGLAILALAGTAIQSTVANAQSEAVSERMALVERLEEATAEIREGEMDRLAEPASPSVAANRERVEEIRQAFDEMRVSQRRSSLEGLVSGGHALSMDERGMPVVKADGDPILERILPKRVESFEEHAFTAEEAELIVGWLHEVAPMAVKESRLTREQYRSHTDYSGRRFTEILRALPQVVRDPAERGAIYAQLVAMRSAQETPLDFAEAGYWASALGREIAGLVAVAPLVAEAVGGNEAERIQVAAWAASRARFLEEQNDGDDLGLGSLAATLLADYALADFAVPADWSDFNPNAPMALRAMADARLVSEEDAIATLNAWMGDPSLWSAGNGSAPGAIDQSWLGSSDLITPRADRELRRAMSEARTAAANGGNGLAAIQPHLPLSSEDIWREPVVDFEKRYWYRVQRPSSSSAGE